MAATNTISLRHGVLAVTLAAVAMAAALLLGAFVSFMSQAIALVVFFSIALGILVALFVWIALHLAQVKGLRAFYAAAAVGVGFAHLSMHYVNYRFFLLENDRPEAANQVQRVWKVPGAALAVQFADEMNFIDYMKLRALAGVRFLARNEFTIDGAWVYVYWMGELAVSVVAAVLAIRFFDADRGNLW